MIISIEISSHFQIILNKIIYFIYYFSSYLNENIEDRIIGIFLSYIVIKNLVFLFFLGTSYEIEEIRSFNDSDIRSGKQYGRLRKIILTDSEDEDGVLPRKGKKINKCYNSMIDSDDDDDKPEKYANNKEVINIFMNIILYIVVYKIDKPIKYISLFHLKFLINKKSMFKSA